MRLSKWFPKLPTVELPPTAAPFVSAANPLPFDPLHLHGGVPPPMTPADAKTTFLDPTEEEVVMDVLNLATLTEMGLLEDDEVKDLDDVGSGTKYTLK